MPLSCASRERGASADVFHYAWSRRYWCNASRSRREGCVETRLTWKLLKSTTRWLQNVGRKRQRRAPLAVPSIQLNSIPACSWYHWGRHLNPHCRPSLIVSPFGYRGARTYARFSFTSVPAPLSGLKESGLEGLSQGIDSETVADLYLSDAISQWRALSCS